MTPWLAALLVLCSTAALAQNPGVITQGAVVPGNLSVFVNRNMIKDGGAVSSGSVTSVGLTLPNIFIVSGSPVTGSGTLTGTLATETQSTFFAGPVSPSVAASPTFRVISSNDLPGAFSGFSVCSGLVSTLATTGTAATAVRSDGACALDQTAAYAFTGLGLTHISDATQSTSSTTGSLTTAGGLGVAKDAFFANSGTFAASVTAATVIATSNFRLPNSNAGLTLGLLFWNSRSQIASQADGSINLYNSAGTNGVTLSFPTALATPTLQLGAANADTTGASQAVQPQGVTTGGTNNQAGGNLTISSGQGKGNVGSSLIFQTPIISASGNTLQVMATAFKLDGRQHASYGGSKPTVSACGTGSPSIDANATDSSGTVTVGTVATGCTITFANAYTSYNHCTISSQTTISGLAYTYNLSAITLSASVLGGDLIDYRCDGV